MTDREKAIKHFKHLLNAAKGNYQDFVDLTVDCGEEILALLKEQTETIKNREQEIRDKNERLKERAEQVDSLLKEQKAKCLTKAELDDLDENQFVWIEGRTGYLYCLQIIGICRGRTGVSDIQFNAPTSYVERSTNRYGKSYRIWTNKPTEEQSQAVKWDG